MLVTFAVDPEALRICQGTEGLQRGSQSCLIRLWRKVGVFLLDSETQNAIDKLPQSLRKLWKTALKKNRSIRVSNDWKGLDLIESTAELTALNDVIDLACLDDVRAECIGMCETKVSEYFPNLSFEICRFAAAGESKSFGRALSLAKEGIPRSMPVWKLWKERFSKLAQNSKHVVIVDRYAIIELCYEQPKRRSGLRNFLTHLNMDAKECFVSVFSSLAPEFSKDEMITSVETLTEGLSPGGIREFTVYLNEDNVFKIDGHDRWVRFDDTVCEIGVGLSVMGGERTGKQTTFTAKSRTDISRRCEKKLKEGSHNYLAHRRP